MVGEAQFKAKDYLQADKGSALRKYRLLFHGNVSTWAFIRNELIILFTSGLPGVAGLFLRSKLYPRMFKKVGRGVVFGRNITLRHPCKISIGDGVIIDDNVVLDAKGNANRGITIGSRVFIGRNTIIYCKDGDITIEDGVNLSSNCQVFSAYKLTIGRNTVVGAFSYFLSGGMYDLQDVAPFGEQSGLKPKEELVIGPNCWIGANVTVLDAASLGQHCVVGAGAVVTKPLMPDSMAVGIPARVVRKL